MTSSLSRRMPSPSTMLLKIERFDRTCIGWVVAHRRAKLDPVFVVGSHGGQVGLPWAALVLVLRLRSSGGRILPRRGLSIVFGSWAVAHALKRTNNRSRPCRNGEALPLIKCPQSSSLPSDEAASAFAGAVYVSLAIPRLALPLFAGATLTAASRVYVGVHYPSDVASGALLGAAIARLLGRHAVRGSRR
jgi:membrane-associated phospholipid phosphatase